MSTTEQASQSIALPETGFRQGPLRAVIEAYLRSQGWYSYHPSEGWSHPEHGNGLSFQHALIEALSHEWEFPGHDIYGRYEPTPTFFVPESVCLAPGRSADGPHPGDQTGGTRP